MNKIIFYTLLISCLNVYSQNWFTNGSTWYFDNQYQTTFDARGYSAFKVDRDTVIDTVPAKVINVTRYRYNGSIQDEYQHIVFVNDSSVFIQQADTFRLLYDFSLNAGDTLHIEIENTACDSISPIVIDSVKVRNIEGVELQVQYISYSFYLSEEFGGQTATMKDSIYERIGNLDLFDFKLKCHMDGNMVNRSLRCYSDSTLNFVSKWWETKYENAACDSLINESVGIGERISEPLEIYPNPTNDLISLTRGVDNIILLNSLGKVVEFKRTNLYTLDLSELPKGLYYLKTDIKTFKIIKL